MVRRVGYLRAVLALLVVLPVVLLTASWLAAPWWVAIVLLTFLAGIVSALFFLRNILVRRFESGFVAREMQQQEDGDLAAGGQEKGQLRALEERWHDALGRLNRSHLKMMGDPVHALPWYLTLGAAGSGKSSALKSARLSSPCFEEEVAGTVSPTENCAWRFFEKSIVLDTAGRYACPEDAERDGEEWQKLVALMVRYRHKEPLNGVVLAVAADRLLAGDPDLNRAEGHALRRRLDELLRVFKVRFPVYVLVTKCDLIEGMEPFCALLPEEILTQPMGMLNEGMREEPLAFSAAALEALTARLRGFRLQLLEAPRAQGEAARIALFPEEFARLREPLNAFLTGVFQSNPYQETPALRGLFFVSSLQQGTPLSLLAENLQPAGESRGLPASDRSFFLTELFAAVLPRDRSLLTPTKRGVRWRTATARLGVAAWVLLVTALCGTLGYSFLENLHAIRDASAQLLPNPVKGGDPAAEVGALEKWRSAVLRLEARNDGSVVPRLGLLASLEVERGLKERYCRRFKSLLLVPLDSEVERGCALLRADSPDAEYSRNAMHLIRRVNLLKARLRGGCLKGVEGRLLPEAPALPEEGGWAPLKAAPGRFGELYRSYLSWSDPASLRVEAEALQARLKDVLALRGGDLRWLCDWVEHHEGLTPLTLAPFWGGIPAGDKEPVIYPTFTRKGRARLNALVVEIESAAGKNGQLAGAKTELDAWQRHAAFLAWHSFAEELPAGIKRLRGNSEWQRVAAVVATDQGPYFAFLNRLTWELEPLSHEEGVPLWLRRLFLLQGARLKGGSGQGVVTKAADGGAKVIAEIRQKVRGSRDGGEEGLDEIISGWRDYGAALARIAPAAASRAQSFQLASQTFSDDPATGRSPFFAAYHALNRIKVGLGGERAMGEFPWRVVAGPMDFLWSYIREEAAAQLQAQWEEQVVPGAAELPAPQAAQVLLGPDGLAWKFAKGPAAPFLVRTEHGFTRKEVLGATLPLDGAFFSFMAKGTHVVATALSRQSNYQVGIRAFPSEANADASVHPHGTRLDLLCSGSSQSLVNLNYPTAKTFTWATEGCGDVVLQMEVGDLVLTRRYGGPMAFPQFLQDFASGSRTFSAADFPGERGALERMGIRQIKVSYQFTGSAPVIKQAAVPAQAHVPRSIGRSY